MASKRDLGQIVRDRSRRIASEARARVSPTKGSERNAQDPGFLGRVLRRLPELIRDEIRVALGPDPKAEQGRALLSAARRKMNDVRNREAAVEAARRELSLREGRLEENEFELRAQKAKVEKSIAAAQRAAREATAEMRLPLAQIHFDPSESPRPLRGVSRLAANIKRFGQLTPVVVRPTSSGEYTLVTGYRRMAALKKAECTHVVVRVVRDMDDDTAAALYAVENYLVDGVSSNAVKNLASQVPASTPLHHILEVITSDDESVVEDVYLEDMVEEAQHALAEGAAWVSALRPYWSEIEEGDRMPLEQLIVYFARVAARLK